MSISQRILFTKNNPFEGSDGFSHLTFGKGYIEEHQNKSFAYKHFNHRLREFGNFFKNPSKSINEMDA